MTAERLETEKGFVEGMAETAATGSIHETAALVRGEAGTTVALMEARAR